MRKPITRFLIAIVAVLGLVIATASMGLARPSASLSDCPTGRVGLMVQWANAHVSLMCGTASAQQDTTTPPEIVGLVVRWADGSVGTIDLLADQPAVAETAAETSMDSSSTSVSSTSSSVSQSSSTSTSCINGQCTTTTTVCVDSQCSSGQP